MTIGNGSYIEIALEQRFFNMQVLNVFQYRIGAMVDPVLPVNIAEAWWNDVKSTYRALMSTSFAALFQSVRVKELNNPAGAYAQWMIPTAEQVGTRTPPANPDPLPPFNAAGVRLVVGTRVTRPGQKRVIGGTESDTTNGGWVAAYLALLAPWAANVASSSILGAPAALVEIDPIITRKDAHDMVLAHQDVTGYIINPNVTSQNTRKFGRGS